MSSAYFLIGKTLGKYQIVEHLGHGGMAEVYLCQQTNLERQVALKILHPFLAEDAGFVSRFQREARLVAALRHPNIVQVYDFDHNEEYGIYYMVMEYIPGATLKEHLAAGDVPLKEGVAIVAAIADALDYAHRRGTVHRDVKPANIMFTAEGQPVLADFGIARMLSLTGLTASGAMVGTPAYMAPEIGMGESGTPSSEIYSLGVVLYETVTGHLPFEAEVPMALVMKHINDPVPSPTRYIPTLPASLETAILKTLAKKPEERFARAGELAAALRQALDLESPAFMANGVTPSPANSTPAPSSTTEEGNPLLRTWASTSESPPPGASAGTRKRSKFARLTIGVLLFIIAVLLGIAAWPTMEGQLPSLVQQLFPPGTVTPAVSETESIPTATATALAVLVTITPTPTAETVTVACTPRTEVLRIYVSPPEAVVPPETTLIAYITLRNGGDCAWPAGVYLAFISGEQLDAPPMLGLASLAAGEQLQVLLPLHAPAEPGEYTSVWEVHLPDGRLISGPIELVVEVGELPTYTPTPLAGTELTATPTPCLPLTLSEPQLLEWQVDGEQNLWTGNLALVASGGTEEYRFYQDVIREDTELVDGAMTFTWQRCENYPLVIIVVSGEEVTRWEGSIPYPAPKQCEP
ncbi:MAG: protein kinase [Anaerolineae bacterium]|nr:protein kinase [Anaerolineae bacterium]